MKHRKSFYVCIVCMLCTFFVQKSFAADPIIKVGATSVPALKVAVEMVNQGLGDHITIESSDPVVIEEEIVIQRSVTIEGIGAGVILQTQASDSDYRLFQVNVEGESQVSFKNLILSGGDISERVNPDNDDISGGILYLKRTDNPGSNLAYLHLENVKFLNAKANRGGAISTNEDPDDADAGGGWDVTLSACTFENNEVLGYGAALFLYRSKLSISGGSEFTNNVAQFAGGALFLAETSLRAKDCMFTGNKATGEMSTGDFSYAGAIYVGASDEIEPVNFENVKFTDNLSLKGGGGALFLEGIGSKIIHCTFNGNKTGSENESASDQYYMGEGGAIQATNGSILDRLIVHQISNSRFENNQVCNGYGGAIYFERVIATLSDGCVFDNNSVGKPTSEYAFGGAISFQSIPDASLISDSEIRITDAKFTNNKTSMQGDECDGGGALFFHLMDTSIPVVIENTLFEKNISHIKGGAIFAIAQDFTVHNSQFYNNSAFDNSLSICAEQEGGAIYLTEGGYVDISDCHFEENYSGSKGGALSVEMLYSGCDDEDVKTGFEIKETQFINNYVDGTNRSGDFYSLSGFFGGAVYVMSCTCSESDDPYLFENVVFENNHIKSDISEVSGFGGAMAVSNGEVTLAHTNFLNNHITLEGSGNSGGGGAIFTESTSLSIKGQQSEYAVFSGNHVALSNLGYGNSYFPTGGGAVNLSMGKLSIEFTSFENNQFQVQSGEAIYSVGGGAVFTSYDPVTPYFYKTTFSGNNVSIANATMLYHVGGGAIFSSSPIAVNESTFAYNYVDIQSISDEVIASGGGAIHGGEKCDGVDNIVNTTITRNYVNLPDISEASGGGGVFDGGLHILNSVLVGNYLHSDPGEIEDIYIMAFNSSPICPHIATKSFPAFHWLKMAHTVYQKINGNIGEEDFKEEHWLNHLSVVSDVNDVFGAEPALNNHVIPIRRTGKAALKGSLVGMFAYADECCMKRAFYFREGDEWNAFDFFTEYVDEKIPFDKENTSTFGLTKEVEVWNDDMYDFQNMTISGSPLLMAQNTVDRLLFGHERTIYNAGSYALTASPVPPVTEPEVSLQWSVSVNSDNAFADVDNGQTTEVKEPTPVYVQIRPEVQGVDFDSWLIHYSATPDSCYFTIDNNIPEASRYTFNNGGSHAKAGTYVYTVTSVTLFRAGNEVGRYSFNSSPYLHTIKITPNGEPGTDPDPVWPPVLPDPDEPDPNTDGWIIVKPLAPFCYQDGHLIVTFLQVEKNKNFEYAVAFTDKAKEAGFRNVDTFSALPQDGVVAIPVQGFIPKGIYYGYLALREKGKKELSLYKFEVEVVEYIRIIEKPISRSNYCKEDVFELTVKAEGDVLSYQWYYKNEKIPGATTNTYKGQVSEATIGDYYVRVTGYCDTDTCHAAIGMNGLLPLLKWDDVLWIDNTAGKFSKFQWFKDGQPIEPHGNSVYYTEAGGFYGSYFVRAYTSENNYVESCPIDFPVMTRSSSISVFPNPANRGEYVNVQSDERGATIIGSTIELYDLNGRKVYHAIAYNALMQVPAALPTGVYILHIRHLSGKITTEKVTIK